MAAYELPSETGSFTSIYKADIYPHLNAYSPSQLAGMGQLGSPVAGEEPGPGCGHEDFIRREELERRREHLIRDDRMVVRCDVAVTEIHSSYPVVDHGAAVRDVVNFYKIGTDEMVCVAVKLIGQF